MNWLAALGLVLGIALLVAALVVALAKASTTPADRQPAAQLRAADAVDGLRPASGDQWTGMTVIVPPNNSWQAFTDPVQRPGEDDQWSSFTDTVPNIRRLAASDDAPVPDSPKSDNP